MDFFETAAKRFSYRGAYKDQPVPPADLDKILTVAIQAPSGYNQQTTSFVVVTDPALRQSIHEMIPGKHTGTAPVLIIVLTEKVEKGGLCFEVEDYGAAVENLLLAITAAGYASVWTDGETKMEEHNKKIAALLNVPAHFTVRAVLPLGVPAETGCQQPRKPLAERVTYNRFV